MPNDAAERSGILIQRLEARGVTLSLGDAGKLSVSAPKGVLTESDAGEIRDLKDEIISLLKGRLSGAPSGRSPLTPAQERMWSHGALHPDLPLYVIPAGYEFIGDLDADRLMAAFDSVAARFDVFRMRIDDDGDVAVQRFDGEAPRLERIDLAAGPDLAQRLEMMTDRICRSLIDPVTEPLVRAGLVTIGADRHQLLMGIHHLAWDGRSFALFITALADAYAARVDGAAAPFGSYAKLPGVASPENMDWWTDSLAAPPPAPELPADRVRPALFDQRGATVRVHISPETVAGVRRVAASARTTPFSVYTAGFSAFLSRMDGSGDRIIGLDSDERPASHAESIGCFVNTVLYRDHTSTEHAFVAAVEAVGRALPEALSHPAPVADIVAAAGFATEPSRPTGAQVMVSHQYSEVEGPTFGKATCHRLDFPPITTAAELAFNILEAEDEVTAELQYATSLFSSGQASALANALSSFLEAAVAQPSVQIADIPIRPRGLEDAYRALNDTAVADAPPTALSAFLKLAAEAPEADAILYHGETVTYDALCQRAAAIAAGLKDRGIGPGYVVGISVPRSPDMIASVFAVWMTGAAYLPLDPELPPARRELMIEDSGCELVLGVDEGEVSPSTLAMDCEAPEPAEGDIAYVMYTSGSTGRPKGVVNGHGQVANFLRAMAMRPGFTPKDRLLAVTTLSFDISILELFLPLSVGGTVILPDADEAVDGEALARLASIHGATMIQGTPATFRLMLDAGWPGDRGLAALCGGEPLPSDLAAELLPKTASLWNMYGPTETTVWSTVAEITDPEDITVGTPIDNTSIYISGPRGELLPPGLPGELLIGGDGVALGYHGRADLTAERFIADPYEEQGRPVYRTGDRARLMPDGRIAHMGRLDTQLKLRGFRIEAGEIETALVAHEDIAQAVCVVREQPGGEGALVAYFTVADGFAPTGSELRRWLKARLPHYMVPQIFVELDELPLTPNGKIDRQALPAPAGHQAERRQAVPPSTPHEMALAEIWGEVLKTSDISVTDNFFELGGQSLQAARVAAQFRVRTGARIQPRALIFETLAQLAAGAVQDA